MPERSKAPDPREETPDDDSAGNQVPRADRNTRMWLLGSVRDHSALFHDGRGGCAGGAGDDTNDVWDGGNGMKKRLEKKAEKMRRKKVHEILEMVLEINGTHPRSFDRTGDKATASFTFSGVVASVEAEIYRDGWDFGKKMDFFVYAYIDTSFEGLRIEDVKSKLKDITEELRHAGKM